MRIALLTTLIAALGAPSTAPASDVRAKTADGREVLLKDDGTWSFVEAPKAGKDPDAVMAYQGKRENFAIHLKPDAWKQADKPSNPAAEVMFTRNGGEVYAMVISERISVPLETLKNAALANMQKADKEAKIVREEPRKVDDVDMLCVTTEVTVRGIPLTFHSYYYAGPAGSIQAVTWTGRNLFEEFKPEMEKFLDGLVILKK